MKKHWFLLILCALGLFWNLKAQETTFSFNFNDGSLAGWTVRQDADALGDNWQVSSGSDSYYAYDNSRGVYSTSYISSNLNPKNYIITAKPYLITSESVLSWDMRHNYPILAYCDYYKVIVSEDGETFEDVWSGTASGPAENELSFEEKYVGKSLYIGFYHWVEDGKVGDAIVLDNIVLTAGGSGSEPEPSNSCDVVFTLKDSYGDGWNGASLSVNSETLELNSDYYSDVPINFEEGETVTVTYNSGSYDSENTLVLKYDGSDANTGEISCAGGRFSFTFTVDCSTSQAPLAPANLQATNITPSTVTLSWNAVDGATNYKVYSVENGNYTELENIPGTSSTITGLSAETQYTFAVTAVNLGGESAKTEVNATTKTAPTTPPAKPTGLTATANGMNEIILSWDAVDGATLYYVYQNGSSWATTQVYAPNTSCTVSGLSAGTQYYYEVVANNEIGNSERSDKAYATTESKLTMIDFDKYYRIKVNSVTRNEEYLTIFNYDGHEEGPKGGVGVATKETNRNQIFKFESAGNDNVYLRSAHDNGNERYIYCQKWNVDAINNSDKSVLGVHPLNDGLFYLTDYYYYNILGKENQYFKVEFVDVANYVFSDAPIGDAATWSLEEVTVPSAPTIQATDVTYNSISLSWDAVNGAESYNVYKDNVFVESILGTTYTATGLASETEYCFTVEAVNVSGASAKSASACATTTAVLAPSAPTNLTAIAIDEYSIRLEWEAVGAAESYNVYKSGSLIEQGITDLYYINSDLLPGTNHCYTVTSFNATNGESVVHSEEVCATTVALPAPDAPANLTATVNGTSSIILDWTAVGSASSYNVYMNGSQLATSLLSTTYTATGLEAGTNYCFVVKAVNMGGESDESDEVCKITVPAAPVLYARANTQTIITLSWETVKGATSYNVYRDDAFITNITGTTLNEENLAAGTTRSYTITAVNESGESAKSNVATATTLSEGQQEIVIGNSDTENFMIPVHLRNNFSFSQQIYTKDELDFGFRGLITKLTFTQTEDTKDISCYRIVKIYMTNTDQDSFVNGTSSWVQLTDATLVYEGRFDMGTGNPIIEIVFNKEPFVYLGSNILLTVQTSSKNYNDIQQIQRPNPIPEFCGYTSPTCKTLYTYSDGQYVIDPSYWGDMPSYSNFNNTVNFTIEPAGLIYRGRGNWNETAKWLNGYLPKPTDDVYILGRAAITNSVDVNYMVIPDTSIVTLETGTLTVTDKIVNSNENSFVFHDGTQVFQNGEDVKATFKMQIDKPTVWEESHKEGWQFIASPVKNASTSSFETATGDFDLYKYDRTKADEEWRNYKNHPADGAEPFDESFVQGRGYLASYETEETASFAGTLSHEKSFTFEADTYEDGKHYENFYLLGNPFPFDMNLANMNANGVYTGYATMTSNGTYQYLGTDGTVKVGDGFFVLANAANPTVSYTHNARSSRGSNESLNLVVSSNEGYDNVIINLSDENNDGFPKLENFNDEVSELYLLEDDVRYAIMNYNKDVKEVELRFAPKKMGNYTIEAVTNKTTPFNTIILIDRFTGIETNLLMEDYKFTATANDASQRFIVRFAEGEYNNEKSFVFQSGDDLIINGTGTVQIIDVMGRVVYSDAVESTNNRINVATLKKAAYMVRCIEGNQVKTQKIVVL